MFLIMSVESLLSEISKLKPKIKKNIIVKIIEGKVVYNIYLIWSNKLDPDIAAAKFVVSLNGDNLSPKYDPEITAPATIAGSIPRAFPIPIIAIPIVADVDQELPVEIETIAEIKIHEGRKSEGFIIFKP